MSIYIYIYTPYRDCKETVKSFDWDMYSSAFFHFPTSRKHENKCGWKATYSTVTKPLASREVSPWWHQDKLLHSAGHVAVTIRRTTGETG